MGQLPGADVYAVGENGMLHYEGNSWSAVQGLPYAALQGIWGSSGTDIFAVGYDGKNSALQRFSLVRDSRAGLPSNCMDVWGSSADNVYAVGAGGNYCSLRWHDLVP